MAKTPLERLRRHAELYGTEEVYEVAAADGFAAADLGRLALALRTIDPKWRLSHEQRDRLLVRLQEEDLPDRKLREYLGISQDTLRRLRNPARRAEKRRQKRDSAIGPQIALLGAEVE
jgi:hypothetical protein